MLLIYRGLIKAHIIVHIVAVINYVSEIAGSKVIGKELPMTIKPVHHWIPFYQVLVG